MARSDQAYSHGMVKRGAEGVRCNEKVSSAKKERRNASRPPPPKGYRDLHPWASNIKKKRRSNVPTKYDKSSCQ